MPAPTVSPSRTTRTNSIRFAALAIGIPSNSPKICSERAVHHLYPAAWCKAGGRSRYTKPPSFSRLRPDMTDHGCKWVVTHEMHHTNRRLNRPTPARHTIDGKAAAATPTSDTKARCDCWCPCSIPNMIRHGFEVRSWDTGNVGHRIKMFITLRSDGKTPTAYIPGSNRSSSIVKKSRRPCWALRSGGTKAKKCQGAIRRPLLRMASQCFLMCWTRMSWISSSDSLSMSI
jgi:hypothetical protein